MAEPAGLTFMEDKSPPTAPNAPLMALNRAEPVKLSMAYRNPSFGVISCEKDKKLANRKLEVIKIFFIIFYFFS
jgi:hypothetical protein